MNKLRKIIREEIRKFLEADEPDKQDKEKDKIDKEKLALDKEKLDFQKQQAADKDREADQRDAEKEKEDQEQEKSGEGEEGQQGGEEEKKPNISFNSQGDFYANSYPALKNLVLSSGDLLDDEERHFIALAIQASKGRFDKGFKKYLKTGYAGNVYGKDFSTDDINKIIQFVKKNELVR